MSRRELLADVRVLDLSGSLAGIYAGRLLADAGAYVTRPADAVADLGDPGTGTSQAAYRALEALLDAGKMPAESIESELRRADVVLDTGAWPGFDAVRAYAERPDLVVVSVTDYGLTGPHAGRVAGSALRQAQSGSTSSRGVPSSAPLAAAGETEQFLAGAYAAAAALAALHGRDLHGAGDLIDLSLLEVSNIGQTIFGTTQAGMHGRLGEDFPLRSVQIPANERTRDGWVGLCTISARQRQDLLLVMGRADLADDESHAYGNENVEVDESIRRSVAAWTREQTTQEVIDLASALRIPVSPLVTGATMTDNEQLVARGFFERGEDGVLRPGPTFRYRPHRAADRPVAPPAPAEPAGAGALAGVKVVDLTAWWAGPSATHLFAASGADVVKIESVDHADGMRYSFVADPAADLWWERGPVFYALNTNKRGITLDLASPRGAELFTELVAQADVLIENFTPRVLDSLAVDWDAVRARNPRLITVRMPAFGLDGPWRDRTGFAQTIEQSSGLAWTTGHPDGPPVAPRGICDPLAGIHAAFATLSALHHQRRTGLGGAVEVSMIEPAAYAAFGQSLAWQLDGELVDRIGNRDQRHGPQGVYATSGEGEWVCVSVRTPEQWDGLVRLLGHEELADEVWRDPRHRIAHADRLDAAIAAWTRTLGAAAVVDALTAAQVPAARVDGAGRLLDNPQLVHRRFFEAVDHPVAGSHPIPGLPYRSANQPAAWNRTPAPTLGQHTAEVLEEWLGLAGHEIERLHVDGVSGTRPAGLVTETTAQ